VPVRPDILLNLSVPQLAETAAALPAAGVGLMRAEFLALGLGTHPQAILAERGEEAFVAAFADGLRTVAQAFHPRPVTYRTLDLKSNEYRGLVGGERFEPIESNPMIGRRGAYRSLASPEEFLLELRAVARVLDEGLDNIHLMVPFVRTVDELRRLKEIVRGQGLFDRPGFELWAMAEVPAFALLPERFAAEVAGVSIGSNDLTQLVLGVDRDSAELGERYRADDEAVLAATARIIEGAHAVGVPVCICGDAPSSDADLVRALVDLGIDQISVAPPAYADTVAAVDAALRVGEPG
jgi:phosphoenolpyruvate synthase/pyruvate phosphate dikinase